MAASKCSHPGASLMRLIKSKKRVADHGEVFTPQWMVEAMLNLVKDESERIADLRDKKSLPEASMRTHSG